jgi:hypothetical protein
LIAYMYLRASNICAASILSFLLFTGSVQLATDDHDEAARRDIQRVPILHTGEPRVGSNPSSDVKQSNTFLAATEHRKSHDLRQVAHQSCRGVNAKDEKARCPLRGRWGKRSVC